MLIVCAVAQRVLQSITACRQIVTQVNQTGITKWIFVWNVGVQPASIFLSFCTLEEEIGDAIRPLFARSFVLHCNYFLDKLKATVEW